VRNVAFGFAPKSGLFVAFVETIRETIFGAEVNRIAGEIALLSTEPDAAKADAYFERALTIARQQQAKSWELRAAMSLARLWRSQGKVQQARELLAPDYGWFTEGFDTRDLKEAKSMLRSNGEEALNSLLFMATNWRTSRKSGTSRIGKSANPIGHWLFDG
jgi:hypothetical protein